MKAKQLQEIFDKVKSGVKNADVSVLDVYRISRLRLGKAHRVETLMQDINEMLGCIGYKQNLQNGIAKSHTPIG